MDPYGSITLRVRNQGICEFASILSIKSDSLNSQGPLITFTGITLGVSSFGIAYRSFGELDPNARVLHRERRESLRASK